MIEAVDGSQGRPELARLQAGRALDCVGAAAGPAAARRSAASRPRRARARGTVTRASLSDSDHDRD